MRVFFIATCLLTSIVSSAQEISQGDTTKLPPSSEQLRSLISISPIQLEEIVIVEEKRLSGTSISVAARNVEFISAQQIKALPVQSVNEALQYISGVDLRQRGPIGSQADLTMMGSTFEQVLILVNGIPLRDPQTGHNQLNLPFDLNLISHFEVIKGSAARIYGANAMAGAINVVTKYPGKERAYFQLYTSSPFENDTASGDQYYAAGARAGVGFEYRNTGHSIDVSYQKTNGYRYNSFSEQKRISYLGAFRTGAHKLTWMAGTIFNEFGANGFYSPAVDKNSVESVNTSFGSLKYEYQNNGWRIAPLAYMRYNHDDYNLNAFNYRNNHFTTTAGAELHASKGFGKFRLGAGYESRAEFIRSNNLGKHERFYNAVYTEVKYNVTPNSYVILGANTQYNNDYGWNFYPGLEVFTPIYRSLSFFANAGLANRLPTYTDLYYEDRGNIGNADLKPENAVNVESGFRYNLRGITQIQISGFVRDVTDFIDFVRENPTDRYQPQNFQHVQVRGGEIRTITRFRNSLRKKVRVESLRVNYSYLDATLMNMDKESKYALQHLRHQIVAGIDVLTTESFSHSINMRYNERFNGLEYGLVDYRVRFNRNNWSIFGDINNLLDREYIESGVVPMPGRWYRIGVEYRLR